MRRLGRKVTKVALKPTVGFTLSYKPPNSGLESSDYELQLLAEEVEAFIQETVPAAESISKYGGKLFTLTPQINESQFCGVFIYTNHVQLSFSKGAFLSDPDRLLSGSGKLRRHLNMKTLEQLDMDAVAALLTEAVTL